MKRLVNVLSIGIVVVAALLLLVGCEDDPTPTPSPLATPEAEGAVQVIQVRRQAAEPEPLTAEVIAAVLAGLISVLLEVVPGLAAKWEKIDSTYKRLAWLIGCLVIPLAVLGAGCLGLDLGVIAPACDQQGAIEALKIGFAAYFAGQATYTVVGQAIRKKLRKR